MKFAKAWWAAVALAGAMAGRAADAAVTKFVFEGTEPEGACGAADTCENQCAALGFDVEVVDNFLTARPSQVNPVGCDCCTLAGLGSDGNAVAKGSKSYQTTSQDCGDSNGVRRLALVSETAMTLHEGTCIRSFLAVTEAPSAAATNAVSALTASAIAALLVFSY